MSQAQSPTERSVLHHSEKIIQERLNLINQHDDISFNQRKSTKYLVDPFTGEIVNECELPENMLQKYDTHLNYLYENNVVTSTKLKALTSAIGLLSDLFEITITLSACLVYVLGTYYEDDNQQTFAIIDIIIATIFLIDYCYHLYHASRKWDFILSKMSIIDLLTILPVYLENFSASSGADFSFFRMMRIFRVLRILRMYKAFEGRDEEDENNSTLQNSDSSGISKQIMILVVTLFSMLFIGSGIAHTLYQFDDESFAPTDVDFDFEAAFYFLIVTSSTLGYGDFFPIQTLSRMVCIILILAMVYIIGQQLSKIAQLMANYSKYDTTYNSVKHIVIMGAYRPQSLLRFLTQFYHPDHGNVTTQCIIIGEEYPEVAIISIIEDSRFEGKVFYLESPPSDSITFNKANIAMAESVFILTNQHESDPERNDINAILISRLIQDYSPFIKTYVQLVRPYSLGLQTSNQQHVVVSVQEVKMGILGAAINNPGFTTVMASLYINSGANIPDDLQTEWANQYGEGISQEFYCVPISDYFIGMQFSEAVKVIYLKMDGILTIGVKTENTPTHCQEILINPANYILDKGDSFFVITDDLQNAQKVSTYYETRARNLGGSNPRKALILSQVFKTTIRQTQQYECILDDRFFIDLWDNNLNDKISGHILVFASLEGFSLIVQSVRAYGEQPVCIVNPNDPDQEWDKIRSKYSNVFYLKGNILNLQELYNSGVQYCSLVLVLPSVSSNEYSLDSDAVLGCRLIESNFPHVQVVLELIDESFIRFLGSRPKGQFQTLGYNMWPKYISGRCYFSSYLESLICQTYYNPDLISILLKLIGLRVSDSRLADFQENQLIRSIKIPKSYFGEGQTACCRYEELFTDLLSLDPPPIPLAILSRHYMASADDSISSDDVNMMKKLDYEVVFTNPLPGTMVYANDSIICIGSYDPSLKETDKNTQKTIFGYLQPETILEVGLAQLMLNKLKENQSAPEQVLFSKMLGKQLEMIELLTKGLQSRLEPHDFIQRKIMKRQKLIDDLNRATEKLRMELISLNEDQL